jgi:hypothetical protein
MKIITDTSLNYFDRTLEKTADLLGFLIYAVARKDKGSLGQFRKQSGSQGFPASVGVVALLRRCSRNDHRLTDHLDQSSELDIYIK